MFEADLGTCNGVATWYRIGQTASGYAKRVGGDVTLRDRLSGSHANITFTVRGGFGQQSRLGFTLLANGNYGAALFETVRVVGKSGSSCPIPNPNFDPNCQADSDAGVTCEPETSGTGYCPMYLEVAMRNHRDNSGPVYASFANHGHDGDWVPEPFSEVDAAAHQALVDDGYWVSEWEIGSHVFAAGNSSGHVLAVDRDGTITQGGVTADPGGHLSAEGQRQRHGQCDGHWGRERVR